MRDPERIDRILEKFGQVWKKIPDQRFLQIVSNIMKYKGEGRDMFFIEDDDLEIWLEELSE